MVVGLQIYAWCSSQKKIKVKDWNKQLHHIEFATLQEDMEQVLEISRKQQIMKLRWEFSFKLSLSYVFLSLMSGKKNHEEHK